MRSINPFAMDFTGAATDTASYPTSPTPQQGSIIKSQNPYSFTGQDANGMFMGGGEMPEQQVRTQGDGGEFAQVITTGPDGQMYTDASMRTPYNPPPAGVKDPRQPGIPQGINIGQQYIPAFRTSDLTAPSGWGESDIQRATEQLSGLSENPVSREQALAFLGRQSASLQNVGNYFPGWDTLNQDNWRFFAGENPDEMTMWMKDAPKERSNITLRRQGDYWVPQGDSVTREQWDTNKNNRMRNMAFAMMAAGGLAGTYFPGSEAAAAVPEAGLSVSSLPVGATDAGITWGAGMNTGMTSASMVPGIGDAAFGGVQAVPGLEGSISGAEEYFIQNPNAGPGASAGSGVGNGSAGGIAGGAVPSAGNILNGVGGASNWLDAIRKGAGGLDKLIGGGGNERMPIGGGSRGGIGGGGMGGGILPLLAALYGKEAQGRYADDLKGIATNMRNDAEPFLGKLKDSYTNPNAYFESPDVKARLELEANRLTGLDSSRGRLSNPIERDMLLQKYAAKDINDYRSTLRNNVATMYNPQATADMFAQASAADRARYGDMMALAGLMSMGGGGGAAGGGFRGTVDGIGEIIDAGGDLWDIISDWWS